MQLNAGAELVNVLEETGSFPEFSVPARELDDARVPFQSC